jgi:hypothetical protein
VPYIYTEGGYDTRLECLKEVPKGKVLYHFEKVDMIKAKKILGDTACISGGFPVYLLDHGTKQQVIDEVNGSSTAARRRRLYLRHVVRHRLRQARERRGDGGHCAHIWQAVIQANGAR